VILGGQAPVLPEIDEIVLSFRRNVVVAASAGTGKTHRLTALYVLIALGLTSMGRRARGDAAPPVAPDRIWATTFTRAAAGEIAERVEKALGELARDPSAERAPFATEIRARLAVLDDPPTVATLKKRAADALARWPAARIDTLHGLAGRIVDRHGLTLGLPPGMRILDEDEASYLGALAIDEVLSRALSTNSETAAAARALLSASGGIGPLRMQLTRLFDRLDEEGVEPRSLVLPDHVAGARDLLARIEGVARGVAVDGMKSFQGPARALLDVLAHRPALPADGTVRGGDGAVRGGDGAVRGGDGVAARAWGAPGPVLPEAAVGPLVELLATAMRGKKKPVDEELDELRKGLGNGTLRANAERVAAFLRHAPELEARERGIVHLLEDARRASRARRRRAGALGFGDILRAARDGLRDRPDLAEMVRADVDVLLVDEFQDTSTVQRDLVYLLRERDDARRARRAGDVPPAAHLERHGLFLVGDRKQSIYGFRGADVAVFSRVCAELGGDAAAHALRLPGSGAPRAPHADFVALAESRRSGASVLGFINAFSACDFSEGRASGEGARDFEIEYSPSEHLVPVSLPLVSAPGGAESARGGADCARGGADCARGGADSAGGGADSAGGGADCARGEADCARGGADCARGEADCARGGADSARGEADSAPGRGDTVAGRGDTVAGRVDSAPGWGDAALGRADSAPGRGEAASGGGTAARGHDMSEIVEDPDGPSSGVITRAEGGTGRGDVVVIEDDGVVPEDTDALTREAEGPLREALVAAAWVACDRARTGRPARSYAVLARRRNTLPLVSVALERLGVPYVVAGRALYDAPEVRDVAALVRLVVEPRDRLALATVLRGPVVALSDTALAALSEPGRGIAGVTSGALPERAALLTPDEARRLATFRDTFAALRRAALRAPPGEALRALVTGFDLDRVLAALPRAEARLANVDRLIAIAGERGGSLAAFARWLDRRIADESDEPEGVVFAEDDDAVRLLTIHGSKGLDFPVVVLVDLAAEPRPAYPGVDLVPPQGDRPASLLIRHFAPLHTGEGAELSPLLLLPTPALKIAQSESRAREQAERRRLTYVALTRARDTLVLVSPVLPPRGSSAWRTLAVALPAEGRAAVTRVERAADLLRAAPSLAAQLGSAGAPSLAAQLGSAGAPSLAAQLGSAGAPGAGLTASAQPRTQTPPQNKPGVDDPRVAPARSAPRRPRSARRPRERTKPLATKGGARRPPRSARRPRERTKPRATKSGAGRQARSRRWRPRGRSRCRRPRSRCSKGARGATGCGICWGSMSRSRRRSSISSRSRRPRRAPRRRRRPSRTRTRATWGAPRTGCSKGGRRRAGGPRSIPKSWPSGSSPRASRARRRSSRGSRKGSVDGSTARTCARSARRARSSSARSLSSWRCRARPRSRCAARSISWSGRRAIGSGPHWEDGVRSAEAELRLAERSPQRSGRSPRRSTSSTTSARGRARISRRTASSSAPTPSRSRGVSRARASVRGCSFLARRPSRGGSAGRRRASRSPTRTTPNSSAPSRSSPRSTRARGPTTRGKAWPSSGAAPSIAVS
jgi:ATP-dependent exoDNAse (exonuclease V) beta subunit